MSAEQLLTLFNRNISKNAELLDYIGKNNIFGIIAKTRNESVHSRFVAELLSGDFLEGNSRESTFMHFLDILLYRAGKEGKIDEISEHLRKAVLTRSVMFEKMVSECELTVTDYQKLYSSVNTQKVSEKDDRIVIYLMSWKSSSRTKSIVLNLMLRRFDILRLATIADISVRSNCLCI